MQGTVFRKTPTQLHTLIKTETIQAAHEIGQIRIVEVQLKRLDALTTAAQLQLMASGVGADGDKAFVAAEALRRLGEAVACICLLYTSPSPRDATLSRMPSSA